MRYIVLALILAVSHAAYAYGPNGPDSIVDAEASTAVDAQLSLYGGGTVMMTSCGIRPGTQELDCMSYASDGEDIECQFGRWGSGVDGRYADWCGSVDDTEVAYFSQQVSADTRITTIADLHYIPIPPPPGVVEEVRFDFGFGYFYCLADTQTSASACAISVGSATLSCAWSWAPDGSIAPGSVVCNIRSF